MTDMGGKREAVAPACRPLEVMIGTTTWSSATAPWKSASAAHLWLRWLEEAGV